MQNSNGAGPADLNCGNDKDADINMEVVSNSQANVCSMVTGVASNGGQIVKDISCADNNHETSSGSLSNYLVEKGSGANRHEQHPEQIAVIAKIGQIVKDYAILGDIFVGRGTFSQVYEGVHRTTSERVAIKAIKNSSDNPSGYYSEHKMNKLVRGHPNIVKLVDCISPTDEHGFLIFELCENGEVFHQIIPNVGLSPRDRVGPYFAQIVDAVSHIHSCGICHMDLKPENLFVTASGIVKLGDFGLSVLIEDGPVFGRKGSVCYAAPENLRSKHQGEFACNGPRQGYDGQRADIWSIGIILFVFLYGYTPWDAAHDDSYEFRTFKTFDGSPNRKPWNRMPTVLRTLFHRTVSLRPSRRWTCTALKESINRDLGWHAPKRPHLSS